MKLWKLLKNGLGLMQEMNEREIKILQEICNKPWLLLGELYQNLQWYKKLHLKALYIVKRKFRKGKSWKILNKF